MAQILKKSVKENIILAAKKEFLEKGLKDASLRNIAKGANITVGNLTDILPTRMTLSKQ